MSYRVLRRVLYFMPFFDVEARRFVPGSSEPVRVGSFDARIRLLVLELMFFAPSESEVERNVGSMEAGPGDISSTVVTMALRGERTGLSRRSSRLSLLP